VKRFREVYFFKIFFQKVDFSIVLLYLFMGIFYLLNF